VEQAAPEAAAEKKPPADEKIVKLDALEKEGRHIAALMKFRDEKREIAAADRATANKSEKEADEADEDVSDALVKLYHITRDQDIPPLFRTEPAGPAMAEDDAWRVVTLASLADPAIPPGALSKLAGAGVETMGNLCDFQKKHGDQWNKEVKGIGKVALDKIADATTAFWGRWAASKPKEAPAATEGAPPPAGEAPTAQDATPPAAPTQPTQEAPAQ
jgi:hypothetical protein